MAQGDTPGDGKSSPFGNGNGNVAPGGSSGGNDFNRNPSGNGPKGSVRNFVNQPAPKQPMGSPLDRVAPSSIPEGGTMPIQAMTPPASRSMAATLPGNAQHKPFRLQGAASVVNDGPSKGEGGSPGDLQASVEVPLCNLRLKVPL